LLVLARRGRLGQGASRRHRRKGEGYEIMAELPGMHRIAWAAVKRSYVKVGGSWIGRDRT
jgi:hypothetical protein